MRLRRVNGTAGHHAKQRGNSSHHVRRANHSHHELRAWLNLSGTERRDAEEGTGLRGELDKNVGRRSQAMHQMVVTIPEGYGPGEKVVVSAPDGRSFVQVANAPTPAHPSVSRIATTTYRSQ